MASAGSVGRVLIVVQNLPVPFDRRVWLEATTLRAAGYVVSVICPKARGFDRSYEELEGVSIHRYSLPGNARGPLGFAAEFGWCFLRTFMKSVRVAVRGPGFDVVHACNPPDTYWLLGRFWRVFGKRFVFDHHDLCPEMYDVKFGGGGSAVVRTMLRFLESMTYRTAQVALATNESHRRIAIERGRMSADRVHVVRSGPDLRRFALHQRDDTWRRGKKHLLVYLGEMCVQDGVDYLISALAHLRKAGRDDLHCVLVGGGPHQLAIREHAGRLGVQDLCTFTGRVSDEDLCRILSSADLAVDPDPKTPWSDKSTMNKIMEYMFFGLPIACFDLVENRFSAQDAAVYAEANDDRALAAVIGQLLDDPACRQEMSSRGFQRIRQTLAWEYSVPPLLAAYAQVFDTPRPTASSAPATVHLAELS